MDADGQYKIELDACPTPIILVAPSGKIVRTNQRLDTLFGYEKGELVGQLVEVLVPQESRHHHPDLRDAFFQVPTTRRMGTGRDLHGVRKDGKMLPVEIGLDPLEMDGEMLVIVSVLDIRERKNSEARIRRALDAASSAMLQVDGDGKIELINEAATEMFGYAAEELIGKPIETLVPKKYSRKHSVYRASYHNSPEKRTMGSGRDLFAVRKDGTEFPVEIGLTPIGETGGQSTMATINDITDRKLKEEYIAQKNQQLERLNDELLQFAYSASHDLKAPLVSVTGLLGYCQSDLDKGDLTEVAANLNRCKSLTSRLSKRIEVMLSLAESDLVESEREHVNVGEQIASVWSSLNANGVQFTTDLQHEEPFTTMLVRFTAIIENLLSNAIKFRDTKKELNSVAVRTWNRGQDFCMAVEDNGIGIPEAHQDRVFQLFQRFANSNEPGSGLGLALVKKNVTQLGGEIALQSDNGTTMFTVTLPPLTQVAGESGVKL